MISHLRGTILSLTDDTALFDVNGVGYTVAISPTTHAGLPAVGAEASLWTYLVVRETALDLYGFAKQQELTFFKLLLSVSGVGPKSALAILSMATVGTLRDAIGAGDTSYLTKVSGIGAKSAKKIVLELQDKIGTTTDTSPALKDEADALDALQSLGYSLSEARDALKIVPSDITGTRDRVAAALKHLGSHI